MNDAYKSFLKAGGHVSQNYEFLHQFIEKHGKRYLELSRLSYLLIEKLFCLFEILYEWNSGKIQFRCVCFCIESIQS